jgi:eukaryotic-like serine/threonine-protein kinase
MDAQRWQRVASLFDEAVELEGAERAAHLDACCAGDEALRADVESLLQSDADGTGLAARLIDSPAMSREAWRELTASSSVVGLTIGPWRVVREIGRGGMGVVYLAERADGQYEQRAALKLVRASGDPVGVRRRFLRERQILAQLEHPHITRLLDGGVTPAGEPYFALEYIDGEPLLDHVATRHSDLARRLQLFLEICSAVQFAHRQLVVHCDIKPTNVLVDREGRVKLLDFGIASVLGHAAASADETQLRAMTPAYASPEQLRGEPVTTAADVYALGGVLHEMLTGIRASQAAASDLTVDLLSDIRRPQRPLPSTAASRVGAAAGRKDTTAPEPVPARLLRGDLDVITATALEEEPERRYATVDALADDVRRHLEGAPIAARGASARYRLGKFVARHRVGVALASVALLALLGALGTALLQARRAQEQTLEAQAAAHRAMEQSERAEGVRRILVGVFEQAEPDANEGRPISAHELLEMGERQIEGAFASQPAVEADAATLISELYVQIGDFARAGALLQRALAASDDPRVPDDVKARVLVGISAVESETNAYDAALDHAHRGLALLDRAGNGTAVSVAKAHGVIADVLIARGRLADAEAELRASLTRDAAALGPQSEAVSETWIQLGSVLGSSDRLEEAEKAYRTGIALTRTLFGNDSYHLAHALNELSNLLTDRNDFDGAESALKQSLQIRLRTVGEDHRDTFIVRHNLLVLQETMGRVAEALPERLALLERAQRNGRVHPRDLASYYLASGRDQRDVGQFDAAAPMLLKAIQAFGETLGPTTDVAVSAWRSLGATYALAGRYDEAATALRKAVEIQDGRPGDNPVRKAVADADLANLLRLRHHVDAALALLEPAAAAFDDPARAQSPVKPAVLTALSEAQLDAGQPDAARANAAKALESARASLPAHHFLLGAPLFALARAELALGNAQAAEPLLQEALDVRQPTHAIDDPRMLEVQVARIAAFAALGRNREAATLRADIEPRLRASRSQYAGDLRARLPAGTGREIGVAIRPAG